MSENLDDDPSGAVRVEAWVKVMRRLGIASLEFADVKIVLGPEPGVAKAMAAVARAMAETRPRTACGHPVKFQHGGECLWRDPETGRPCGMAEVRS